MEQGKRTQSTEQPVRRRRPRRRSTGLRIVGGIFLTLWTLLLIGICTAAMMFGIFMKYVNTSLAPSLEVRAEDYTMNLSSFIYYQDRETGQWVEFQNVHGVENRVLVDFDEIPDALWQAAVAIEDERFFEHKGVDWKMTGKAVLSLFNGSSISGGSTITQQVLKNITKNKETTINRKVREIFRALKFEENYNKWQILELYLNNIYLGKGCYGVQTAAQFYFNKDVSELSVAECASLIAITNNPSMYGPMYNITIKRTDGTTTTPREANKRRQGWILDKMTKVINPRTGQPFLTEAQAAAAKAEVLQFSDGSTSAKELVEQATGGIEVDSWFVDQVKRDVSQDLAKSLGIKPDEALTRLYNGGYRIYTTLDPKIQSMAESIYEDRSNMDVTSRDGQPIRSGITIIEPSTGNVVATVGDIGEKTGNLIMSYAMDKRQVGSSMKPLTAYAPAMDAGLISPATTFDNYPLRLLNNNPWPKNAPNTYSGWSSVTEGIRISMNTIALHALETIGAEEAYLFATEKLHLNLVPEDVNSSSLGLGGLTYGLNTMEMAAAYAAFANGGIYNSPRTYLRVTRIDSSGNEVTVLENEGESHVAMKDTTAYLMNQMLKNAVQNGTGRPGRISGMTVAGKTGTTNDNFDRYFVGYTPYYVGAVWVGYKYNAKISYNVNGSTNPAVDLWKKVMTLVHEDLPDRDFDKPATGLERVTVCADSGMRCTDACRADPRGSRAVSFEIAAGTGPSEDCTMHTMVGYCTEGECLAGETCPEESVVQRAYLDYEREDYGSGIYASDDAYLLPNLQKAVEEAGGCPVHVGGELVDPENPEGPVDPENPEQPTDPNTPIVNPEEPTPPPAVTDPNEGGETHEGYGGGPTSQPVTPPVAPEPEPDPEPVTPPAEPVDPPATTTEPGGDWFEGLWNNT